MIPYRVALILLGIGLIGLSWKVAPAFPLDAGMPMEVERGWVAARADCPVTASKVSSIITGAAWNGEIAWVSPPSVDPEWVIRINPEYYYQSLERFWTWKEIFKHELGHIQQFEDGLWMDFAHDGMNHAYFDMAAWIESGAQAYAYNFKPCR